MDTVQLLRWQSLAMISGIEHGQLEDLVGLVAKDLRAH